MKKTFACAIRPNKAPSMRRGLSIISLEHSYGLNGSRIFDPTQLAPLGHGPWSAYQGLVIKVATQKHRK